MRHNEFLVSLALWDAPILFAVMTTSHSWTPVAHEESDLTTMDALAWAEQEGRRIEGDWAIH